MLLLISQCGMRYHIKIGVQNENFLEGYPSYYYSRQNMLNFEVLMGSGELVLMWLHPGSELMILMLKVAKKDFNLPNLSLVVAGSEHTKMLDLG